MNTNETHRILNSELAWINNLYPDADNQRRAMSLQIPSLYVLLSVSAWTEKKKKILMYWLYVNVCKSNPVLSSAETKTHIV